MTPSRSILNYLPVGGTSTDPRYVRDRRGVGRYDDIRKWWHLFESETRRYAEWMIDGGFSPRQYLWAVAGYTPGSMLEFDMILRAREEMGPWLTGKAMAGYFKRIIRDGIEPVVGLGSPRAPTFAGLLERAKTPRQAGALLQRCVDSVKPLLDAGVRHVTIDYIAGEPRHTLGAALVELLHVLLKTCGGVLYVEPTPAVPEWGDYGVLTAGDLWDRWQRDGHCLPPGQIRGEVIRIHEWADGYDPTDDVVRVVREGHTACVGAWGYIHRGIAAKWLRERIGDRN